MIRRVMMCIPYCVFAVSLCGCSTVKSSVPVAIRTPAYCGNVKLYGTDNVPFEYEELGIVSLAALEHTTQEAKIEAFVNEARKMGADAIVNVTIEPANDMVLVIFGFGGGGSPHPNSYRLSGVAVKIRRP